MHSDSIDLKVARQIYTEARTCLTRLSPTVAPTVEVQEKSFRYMRSSKMMERGNVANLEKFPPTGLQPLRDL